MPRRFALLAHAGVLLCQLAALFAIVDRWDTIRGFALDDAWIHQVVARTFAHTGTLGYASGHHGAAVTSYLWATLLAGNYRFLHIDPGVYTFFLGALAYLGCGQCFTALLLRARPPSEREATWALVAGGVAAVASVGGNFVWFAVSGMEAPLVALLAMAAVLLASRDQPFGAGICTGALAYLRPDAALLGPLLALWMRRPRRFVVQVLVPWAAALAMGVGSNLVATGSALPATLAGRRWLYFSDYGGAAQRLQFLLDWCDQIQKYTLGSGVKAALVVAIGLCALGVRRLWRSRDHALQLVLVWTVVHVVTFAVLLPSIGHGGRYQPLVPFLFLGAATLGAITAVQDAIRLLSQTLRPRLVPGAMLAAMAPLAIAAATSTHAWRGINAKGVDHIRATEIAMGERVNQLPAEARVASYDIGGVGFAARRSILDLGALSDARTAQLLRERRAWEWLCAERVDYVILPSWYRDDLPHSANFGYRLGLFGNPALELQPVYEIQTPPDIWGPVVEATWNASPRQVLYKVRYTGAEGPRLSDRLGRAPEVVDPEGMLSWRGAAKVRTGLSVLAANGVRVGLAMARRTQPALDNAEPWRVRFGAWGVDVTVPSDIPADRAHTMVADAVLPYVQGEAWGDAAIASLHAIARIVQRHRDPRFLPFLPMYGPPPRLRKAGGGGNDFPWAALLVVPVLAPSVLAARRARGRTFQPSLRIGSAVAARSGTSTPT